MLVFQYTVVAPRHPRGLAIARLALERPRDQALEMVLAVLIDQLDQCQSLVKALQVEYQVVVETPIESLVHPVHWKYTHEPQQLVKAQKGPSELLGIYYSGARWAMHCGHYACKLHLPLNQLLWLNQK
jgi:hypothetical protein